MRAGTLFLIAALLSATACNAVPESKNASFDTPLPSSERRATLRATVDLAPVSDCDERFDLSLYGDRAVELIQWDEAGRGCAGRVITVRYLPGRITRAALLQRIQTSTMKMGILEG